MIILDINSVVFKVYTRVLKICSFIFFFENFTYADMYFFLFIFWDTSLCVVLAVLEFTINIDQADLELKKIHLPLLSKC